jgi:hypothetical protein
MHVWLCCELWKRYCELWAIKKLMWVVSREEAESHLSQVAVKLWKFSYSMQKCKTCTLLSRSEFNQQPDVCVTAELAGAPSCSSKCPRAVAFLTKEVHGRKAWENMPQMKLQHMDLPSVYSILELIRTNPLVSWHRTTLLQTWWNRERWSRGATWGEGGQR